MQNVKIGDKVQIDPAQAGKWLGVTFEVSRVLKTNVVLKTEGDPRGLRCPMSILIEPQSLSDSYSAAQRAEADRFKALTADHLVAGTVVKISPRPGLYVVAKQLGSGKYQAHKLGGDGDRYLTNVTRQMMAPLTLAEVAEWLNGGNI